MMKMRQPWLGSALIIIGLIMGCAPSYEVREIRRENQIHWQELTWQNPETDYERQMRIWRMEKNR
ncbi:MAG: hypothetical protein QME75_03790 [Deltaproteobacteria bacterium]|nr:hypothetical protein [Deltaproteobacteria bacterium]